MHVWRIKTNSGRGDVDWDGARTYCRRSGVVGVGWSDRLPVTSGAPLDEVLRAAEAVPEWQPMGARMIRRLAQKVEDGDLIWTRDRNGAFWLGRIEGAWRFDSSAEALSWDLGNVRPCRWLSEPLRDYDTWRRGPKLRWCWRQTPPRKR